VFYLSHTSYQIQFGILRYSTYRSFRDTAVENLCALILLLQHSAKKRELQRCCCCHI